jgi:hypothetical protein
VIDTEAPSIKPVNKGGRPIGTTKYTREELEQKINEYFVEDNKPYSVLELCYVLDVTKETLSEWMHNEEKGFSDLIARAKLKIGAGWEKCEKINPRMSEFLLKNHFDYTDKKEINVTGSILQLQVTQEQAEAMLGEVMEARRQRLAATVEVDAIEAKTTEIE